MSTLSVAGLLLRLVVSLVVVLGLMAAAAWVLKRKGGFVGGRSPFTVVARQPLGRTASLQVVTIGDRALVLGVTEHSVTLLAEADPDLFPSPGAPSGSGGEDAAHGTVRRLLGDDRRRPARMAQHESLP